MMPVLTSDFIFKVNVGNYGVLKFAAQVLKIDNKQTMCD